MNKDIKKLFLSLAFYSISGGLFYNFLQLWLASNSLSTKTIGIIISMCSIISVSVIFICTNIIRKSDLHKFAKYLMIFKIIILVSLFILNNTGFKFLIKFLVLMDYAIDVEIFASFYPMISCIEQSDSNYAKRDLIYDGMYYFGVLLTSVLLGKHIGGLVISYNSYIVIAAITMFISFIIMRNVSFEKYVVKEEKYEDIFNKMVKRISKDKITRCYLYYLFAGQISYYSLMGMLITIFTLDIGYSPSLASNIILILGLISVGLGTLVLKKLTFKNDYINLFFKYVMRMILYILVILINNKIFILLAIVYVLITSDSYSHVTEAPYINRLETEYQLSFCNLREMINYLGRGIGTYFCGLALVVNLRLNFIYALVFIILQIVFAYYGVYLRRKENDR